jgi:mono/diheme cytochrome c family protein
MIQIGKFLLQLLRPDMPVNGRKKFVIFSMLLSMVCVPLALAADPVLTVFDGKQEQIYTRTDLLAHVATREIALPMDIAYRKPRRVKAIPIGVLLPDLAQLESLQLIALDGFIANIPGSLLAGNGQAFIAIEPSGDPWPALKSASPASAGPFYLVWLTPEKAMISNEQWPYQITRIAAAAPLAQRYLQLLPVASASAQAMRGLQVYVANCAACHQLNGGGDASKGPDLNRPYSPVEYFNEKYLRKMIRDPASVRSWKGSVMPGFAVQSISDASLDDLLMYFKQMAGQRP